MNPPSLKNGRGLNLLTFIQLSMSKNKHQLDSTWVVTKKDHFVDVTTWPSDAFLLPHYDIAIVTGTYNRAHLLLRSLFHYQACKRPVKWFVNYRDKENIENEFPDRKVYSICLIVMDDGSTDFTRELCEKFANEQLPIYYFYMGDKQPGEWRDSAAFINQGMSFALHGLGSSFVFPTHPEICVGEDTIATIVDYCKENPDCFGMAKGYYLTPEQQEHFGYGKDWTWKRDLLERDDIPFPTTEQFFETRSIKAFIEENPDFYNYGDPTHAYHHVQVEKAKVWDSWIFCGASRQTWLKFGGFGESNAWGSVDLNFHSRRHNGGFVTWTPEGQNNIVVHQNHNLEIDVQTPRDMDLCMKTAGEINNEPLQPELLNPNRWIK